MKTQLENLGSNYAGVMRLKNKLTVNFGSIRVDNDNFVYYSGQGLKDIFDSSDKEQAKKLLESGEDLLIKSGHIAVTPINEIESIIS